MDFIFELIIDLLLESSIEASKSSKIPKPIRIFLFLLVCLFFLSVIALIIWLGFDIVINGNILGILIILFGLLLLILCIIRFRKIYLKR